MLTLHYAPDNASLIVRLALEEAAVPHRLALVDRAARAQEGAAYRAINPAGLVPALETPDGPVFETGAILLWLADRHPGLFPAPADAARGTALSWLFFLSNTAHADLRLVFYAERLDAGRAAAQARVTRHAGLLDAAAASHPALFAPPGLLGAYACALLRWAAIYPAATAGWFDASPFAALAGLARAWEARPALARVAAHEGLGPHPFTAPRIATPRDGSATGA
jgi:glutathione S-transferase